MELRKSTTLPNPAPTSFTEISTSCGTASVLNAANYFTNATPGNHKPFSNVNHFGGSLGGPIVHDKLFFFFDSEWVRIALPIFSTITVPTPAFQQYVLQQLPSWRRPTRSPERTIRPLRNWCRSTRRCSRCMGTPAERRWRCWGVRSTPTAAARRQPAERQRLREPQRRLAFQRRPRAGPDRPHRLQHQPEQHGLVSLPGRHRRAGRLHRPHQPALQFDFAATAVLLCRRLHARLLPEPGQLFQSGIFLVREPVRAEQLSGDAGGISDRAAGQSAPTRPSPPSEDSTIPGYKAGALPASSSMTIWPGATALTSFGLAPTSGSSA